MKIKDFIFFPIVENLRDWYLKRKAEAERKKMLGANKDKVRIKPFTEAENEEEMKKYLLSSTFRDSDGNQRKTEKLGRSMESYYRR